MKTAMRKATAGRAPPDSPTKGALAPPRPPPPLDEGRQGRPAARPAEGIGDEHRYRREPHGGAGVEHQAAQHPSAVTPLPPAQRPEPADDRGRQHDTGDDRADRADGVAGP